MQNFEGKNVISGTHGEAWVDDHYLAEIISLKATYTLDKSEVKRVKKIAKSYKVTGATGKGSIKLHKVDSYFTKTMADTIKSGRQPVFTFTSKLNDPDSAGEERIVIRDATLDTLNLIDWEAGKIGEESYHFTFSDFEILQLI